MKPTFKSLPFRTSFLITVAVCPVFLATGLEAATWVGNTDANLANGLNWDSAPAAPATGEAWVFGAAGTSGAALTNNLATTSAFEVAGITFGAASPAYTITGGAFSLTGNIAATSASAVNLGSNITVSDARQVNLNGSSNITLSGSLSGAGSLTQTAGGTGAKTLFLTGDNSGFTGTFTQTNDNNNRTGFNSPTAGSTAADWVLNRNVAGGVAINLTTTDVLHFGSLSGTGSIRGSGILSVGAKNTSTTWGGTLASNTGTVTLGLTKVGTGTLTMSNTNRHTLATTVNAGVLNITGAMENSPVTVNNGATFQVGGSGKKLQSLAINAGGTAKVGSVTSVTGAVASTGQGSVLDLVNGTTGSMLVDGAGGLTLGGPNPTDTASVKLEAGGLVPDSIDVFNGLAVDLGGAAITITNLGVSAGETYPILSFASGSGAGFATGTGVTVGSLTLANPNLSFGISGQLEVTATGVNLVTTGATPPGSAYWSGTQGAQWSSTSGSNANFTTGATGSTFLNVLPGANTMVYFSHNSPTNLTNTLGANFDIYGLTYRGTSAAVATSGAQTLTLEDGGITVESGNGGATLSMDSIVLAQDQIWSNESANPLVVSAAGVTGPSSFLTMEGDGGVQLGGATFSVDTLEVATDLNLNGTAVTANLWDSPGAITNDASSNAVLTAANHQNATLSGEISDEGPGSQLQLVKTSTGTLTLSGNNIYEGGTTLAGGTLAAGSDEAFGLGVVAITSPAATLDLNGHLLPNDLTNSGTGATITNSSAVEATVEAGFNLAGAAGFVISDFTVNGTGNIRWDGAIRRTNGAGTMTKSGTNTLIINEDFFAAPMGGMNLLVADGTVDLGRTTALCFNNLTINGGTLKMNPAYQVSAGAGVWQGTFGNEAYINGGVWDLNDTGTNGISNRLKRINGTGGMITNNGTGASLLVLAARDTASPSWAGNIQDGTGTVALTIQWGGSVNQVMLFSGTHTYSGDTHIRENVMRAGAANVFSPNSDFIIPNHNVGGKLDLNGFDNTIGSLGGDEPDAQVLLGTATLTTGGKNTDTTFPGVISGSGGLTKAGTGTFTLTGENTYTGDTLVSAGVLAVSGNSIADASKLVISGGMVAPTGTEVVGSLFFGAVQQAEGTWGATGSGATHIDDTRFSGTGVIQVGAAGGYASWAAVNAPTGTAADDYDGDGVPNGVEYLLGGLAATNDLGKLPTLSTSGGNLVFTFVRDQASETGDVSAVIEVGTNLGAWPLTYPVPNDPVSANPGVTVVDNGTGTDTVTLTIPQSPDARKFARLNVVVQ